MKLEKKAATPILGVLLALLVNIIVPNHHKLKYADLPHYRYFLYIALVVTIVLAIVSVFAEKVRERYSYRGFFIAGVFALLTLLDLVTAKYMVLPQIYFPSIARIINVFSICPYTATIEFG